MPGSLKGGGETYCEMGPRAKSEAKERREGEPRTPVRGPSKIETKGRGEQGIKKVDADDDEDTADDDDNDD